jgi:hypothetical protein
MRVILGDHGRRCSGHLGNYRYKNRPCKGIGDVLMPNRTGYCQVVRKSSSFLAMLVAESTA